MIHRSKVAIAALIDALATPASAKELVGRMKNQAVGGAMVFEPMLMRASIDDVIRFVPTDSGHNAQSIQGILPAGAAPIMASWAGRWLSKSPKRGFTGSSADRISGWGWSR